MKSTRMYWAAAYWRYQQSSRISLVPILLCALLASAPQLTSAASDLDAWVEDRLLPYVTERIRDHPRFKGEPIQVVVMKDERILAKMDGLSAWVRDQIVDRLQATSGIRLVWSMLPSPWPYYPSILQVNCRAEDLARVLIAVEVDQSNVSDEVRVSIQALDPVQDTWISGFKQVWVGRPSETARQRLANTVADQARLGSRYLPFGDHQADILASHLARQASCMMRDQGMQSIAISEPRLPRQTPDYFLRVTALLQDYLGRFREIEVVSDMDNADTTLSLDLHPITEDLYQVAVDPGRLSGAPTPGSIPGPVYASLARATDAEAPTLQLTGEESANQAGRGELISVFDLITPPKQEFCHRPDPWDQGVRVMKDEIRLPSGACFALRFQAGKQASLYLYGEQSNGRFLQLLPNDCRALGFGSEAATLEAADTLHIPRFEDGSPGFFLLDDEPGQESIYAIAVASTEKESSLRRATRDIATLCDLNRGTPGLDGDSFEHRLTRLVQNDAGAMEWRAIRFIHESAP